MNLDLKNYIDTLAYDKYYQDIECLKFEGYSKSWKTWENIKDLIEWKDKTVIDLGCFHGYFSFKAEQAGASAVFGLEKGSSILETSEKIKNEFKSKVTFVEWSGGEPTPYADIALVLNMLHHTKDQEKTLQNINAETVIFEVEQSQIELITKYFKIIKQVSSHRIDQSQNRVILLCEKIKKKICIVYGHCLAVSFVDLLSKHKLFTDMYDLIPYYSTAITPLDEKYFKECSLLIYQRAALSTPAIENVNKDCVKISYPYSTLHSLWPWPQKSTNGEYNYRIGSTLIDLVEENPSLSDDEILSKYKDIDISKYFDLDAIYKKDLEKFTYIDEFCDVKFLDLFTSLEEQQAFFTVNHLSIKQKVSMLQKILEKIGCPPLSEEIINEYSEIQQQMIPIHPQIIEHFKLKWVDKNSKYWCFQRKTTEKEEANYGTNEVFGWFTFDEYIKNYIKILRTAKKYQEQLGLEKDMKDIKIFVTGITGSGKTYVAKKISLGLNILYYNFDAKWNYKITEKTYEKEFLDRLPNTFVTDGIPYINYYKSFQEYRERNNVVVICLIQSDMNKWIKNIVNKSYFTVSNINFEKNHLYNAWEYFHTKALDTLKPISFYDNSTNKMLVVEEFETIKKNLMVEIQKYKEENKHILKHYIENLPYVPLRNFQDIECINFEGFSKSWKTWETIKSFVDWKDKTVVDIGPFHGYFSFKIEKAGAKAVTGLEIDKDILETTNIIKKIMESKVKFSLWDGTTPTPEVDIALVLNMLHHTKDKEKLLQNIRAKTVIFEIKEEQMPLVKKYFKIIKEEKSHRIDLDTKLYRYVLLGEKI